MNLRKQEEYVRWLKNQKLGPNLKKFYDIEVRQLRDFRKEMNSDKVVVKQWDDGAIIRIPIGEFPDCETAELFAEIFRLEYRPTYYDCTGQLFTAWQSVHYIGGQWWLYQRNCLDV